jgi:hypothetical protein
MTENIKFNRRMLTAFIFEPARIYDGTIIYINSGKTMQVGNYPTQPNLWVTKPYNATIMPIGECGENEIQQFIIDEKISDERQFLGEWVVISDFREKTAYQYDTKEAVKINFVGELPDILTLTAPDELDIGTQNEKGNWIWKKDIEALKNAKIAEVKALRDEKKYAGITVYFDDESADSAEISDEKKQKKTEEMPAIPRQFKTDEESRVNIMGALVIAQGAAIASPSASYSVEWSLVDGTPIILDARRMIWLGLSLGSITSKLYETARSIKNQIKAMESVEEIEAFDFYDEKLWEE